MSSPSPPRPLRRSPPRRALHERSDSHANEIPSSTLRVSGGSDSQIYTSTPFPTHPAHILSPKSSRQGVVFDDTFGVSDEDGRTEQEFQQLATPSGKGKAGQCSPRDNVSDVSSLSPDRSPPSSPLARKSAEKKGQRSRADLRRMSMDQSAEDDDEIIELPSVPRRRDSRAETIASVSPVADSPSPQAIVAKSSDVSLSSAESSDTIIRSKVRDGPVEPVNASHSAFPTPPQISPSRSPGTPLRPSEKPSSDSLSPGSSSSFPTPAQRISSIPTYGTLQSAVRVQYPTLRPSSFSGSWAESSFTTRLSKRPVRMGEPSTFERWNPHLSTVQSEPTEDRSSESPPPAESPVGRESSSSIPGRPAPLSSHPLSPPQPAFVRQRDGTGSTIRMVGDGDDDDDGDNMTALPEVLPSPPPRSRGSGFLSGFSRDSRRYSASQAGPGQRGSLFRDSIPVWARYIKRSDSQRSSRPQTNHEQNTNHDERVYYSRGARNSLLVQSPEPDPEVAGSRPQSELSPISPIFPRNLFNPRRRPREIDTTRNRDSMAITPVQVTNGEELVEIRGQPRSKYGGTWSPHLWHDRKSVANRRSMFIEPTLPVKDEGLELNKRSAQIVLFAIGFIFPLAWMAASFLPLPPKPTDTPQRNTLARDLEKACAPIDLARYENARWWRNINRMMSIIGLLIIAAIIALAVVSVRMRN